MAQRPPGLTKTNKSQDIEATMFCLNSLSDCLTDEPSEDDDLEELFGSSLFTILSDSQAHIPLKARRTAVNLIGMRINDLYSCYSAIKLNLL